MPITAGAPQGPAPTRATSRAAPRPMTVSRRRPPVSRGHARLRRSPAIRRDAIHIDHYTPRAKTVAGPRRMQSATSYSTEVTVRMTDRGSHVRAAHVDLRHKSRHRISAPPGSAMPPYPRRDRETVSHVGEQIAQRAPCSARRSWRPDRPRQVREADTAPTHAAIYADRGTG